MNVINQFRTFLHIVAQDAPPDIFSCYSNFCLSDQALGARAGALLQARVRGQSRRAVLRQAPDQLRGKPGGISSQLIRRFYAIHSLSRSFRKLLNPARQSNFKTQTFIFQLLICEE